jgi:hypothetical protein
MRLERPVQMVTSQPSYRPAHTILARVCKGVFDLLEHLEEDCFKGRPLSFGSSTTLLLSGLMSNRSRVPEQARAQIVCGGYGGASPFEVKRYEARNSMTEKCRKRAVREPPPSIMGMKLDMWTARLIAGPPANPGRTTLRH